MAQTDDTSKEVLAILENLGIQKDVNGRWWIDDWQYDVTDVVNDLLGQVAYEAGKKEVRQLASLLSKYGNRTEIKTSKMAHHLNDRLKLLEAARKGQ